MWKGFYQIDGEQWIKNTSTSEDEHLESGSKPLNEYTYLELLQIITSLGGAMVEEGTKEELRKIVWEKVPKV